MPRSVTLRTAIGSTVRVDREAGAILNVAVITVGKTKPSANGMDPFDIDAVSLQQVADAINTSSTGVKSRLTHPEVSGEDDITRRVGYIRNARVENGSVRADMYFHNPESDSAKVLFSIAETDAASCGLSIVSTTATLEPAAGGLALRVSSVDAVDWVGEPAANPAGMLSAKTAIPTGANNMLTPEQIAFLTPLGLPEGADGVAIAAFIAGLDEANAAAYAALTPAATLESDDDEEKPAVAASADEEEEKKPAAMSAAKPKPAANEPVDVKGAVALALKAERARVTAIRGIAKKAGKDEAWIVKQIETDAEVGEIALSAINTLKREPSDMKTSTIAVGADLNRDTLNDAVRDAVLLRAGARRIVKIDDQGGVMLTASGAKDMHKFHDRSSQFRGRTIIEAGRMYLQALGYHKATDLGQTELASLLLNRRRMQDALPGVFLAQSTGDFPYLLADAMGKVLRSEYALAPHTWEQWCGRRTVPDFKDIKLIQLSEAANMSVIPEGDEYEFATLTEGQETYAVQTQGSGLKFTRQSLINDDLSAFDRVPRRLGTAAMRAVESKAISILTANAALADQVALFASGHSNVTTGSLAPSTAVASIDAAFTAMQTQTALGSDDPLDIQPRFALVPTSSHFKAKVAFASGVDPSLANATPNPVSGENVTVIPSARLNSNSTTQWYLLADPSQIDTVEMAFLEGEETPVIEEETDFNSDALHMKVRHTFNAKAIDYRGMVRGSGA